MRNCILIIMVIILIPFGYAFGQNNIMIMTDSIHTPKYDLPFGWENSVMVWTAAMAFEIMATGDLTAEFIEGTYISDSWRWGGVGCNAMIFGPLQDTLLFGWDWIPGLW